MIKGIKDIKFISIEIQIENQELNEIEIKSVNR